MEDVLLLAPLAPQTVMTEMEARFRLHRLWEAEDPADLVRQAAEVTALATRGDLGADRTLIDALPNLEVIAVYGVGSDAVDLERCRERGIAVTTTPGVLTDAVAEMALGLSIGLLRRIVEGDRFLRAGSWHHGNLALGLGLKGSKVGILGFGRIGQRCAGLFEAFGAEVLYSDLNPISGREASFRATPEALAAEVTLLVVTVSGGPATAGLVDRRVLKALGPDGYLVNVARGSVVQEADLVAALQADEIGAAALDVFADEPNVPQALIDDQRLVLTPHIASGDLTTREEMGRLVIENLAAHFAGKPLLTPLVP